MTVKGMYLGHHVNAIKIFIFLKFDLNVSVYEIVMIGSESIL